MITDSQNVLVISDTHLGHLNIIQYCNRPSDCDKRMLRTMREARQSADVILHLGDFAFTRNRKEYEKLYRLMFGSVPVILVRGNHDKHRSWAPWHRIVKSQPFTLRYRGYQIGISHCPNHWSYAREFGEIFIHGHSHNNGPKFYWAERQGLFMVNACVEHWAYRPFTLEHIIKVYEERSIEQWTTLQSNK